MRIKVLAALFKTFYWFLGNSLFGIAPLMLIYYIKTLGGNTASIDNELYSLLKGGVLIFFFCSLMGSVTIDIIISEQLDKIVTPYRLFIKFTLVQFPFILLVLVIIAYLLIICGVLPKNYLALGTTFAIIIITFSVFYCLIYKFYNFVK